MYQNGVFNPLEIINMIKQGQNPQQVMMNVLESRVGGTPMGANLIELAKMNKTNEIEQIVRNLAKEKGIDFNQEFTAFKQRLGL